MIVLQILGGIVLIIIAIILVIYLYCRFKFGKYLHANIENEPLIIHLNEDLAPSWLDKPKVKKIISDLEALGFMKGNAYLIYEMPEYFVFSMFKDNFVAAAIYRHNIAGCWVDLVADIKDGMEYTVSDASFGAEMNARPNCQKHYLKGESVKALVSKLNELLTDPNGELELLSANNFRSAFETAYKKDIRWKHRNGGISYEEFCKTANNEAPFKTKAKDKEEAFIQTKENELDNWREAALEEYRELEKMEQEDFYELEYKLLVVPYTTDPRAFIRYLSKWEFVDEKNTEAYSKKFKHEKDVYKVFEKINSLLSPELRANYISELDFPLALKIYKISEKMN